MKYETVVHKTIFAALLLFAATFLTLAAPVQAWSQYYVSRDRIAEFESFMYKHPKASTEMQRNPELVYNRKWLNKHPEVDHFLKGRPELRQAIAHRPGRVFRSYDRYDRRYDRRPYDRLDPRDRRWAWQRR